MDPEQFAAFVAAAGTLLAALGVRWRRGAFDRGRGPTAGLAMARAGAGAARLAGDLTATTGRVASGTAAAGIRIGGAGIAHTAGLVVDGVTDLSAGASRATWSLLRRAARQRSCRAGENGTVSASPPGVEPQRPADQPVAPGRVAKARAARSRKQPAAAPVARASRVAKAQAAASREQPAVTRATTSRAAAVKASKAVRAPKAASASGATKAPGRTVGAQPKGSVGAQPKRSVGKQPKRSGLGSNSRAAQS